MSHMLTWYPTPTLPPLHLTPDLIHASVHVSSYSPHVYRVPTHTTSRTPHQSTGYADVPVSNMHPITHKPHARHTHTSTHGPQTTPTHVPPMRHTHHTPNTPLTPRTHFILLPPCAPHLQSLSLPHCTHHLLYPVTHPPTLFSFSF